MEITELIKRFCESFIEEKNCSKAAEMLAENVCFLGLPEAKGVCSKRQAVAYLAEKLGKKPNYTALHYIEETPLPGKNGSGVGILRLSVRKDGVPKRVCLTATSCTENGEKKIEAIHFSAQQETLSALAKESAGEGSAAPQKQAQAAVEQNKQVQIDSLVDAIPGGMAIYRYENDDVTLLYQSDGVAALSGRTPEEYDALVKGSGKASIHPDDVQMVFAALREAATTEKSISINYRVPYVNGEYVWINGSFRRSGTENGCPILCAVFVRMSEENNLYQFIAQKSSDGIYVISKEKHELLYMNAQAKKTFLLDSNHPCTGKLCHRLLRGKMTPCEDCPVFDLSIDGKATEVYIGKIKKYLSCTSYALDWSGIPAYVVYVSDVTQKRRAALEISTIYNNIPGAVFRCKFDADWTVISANDGLFRFIGYTREEFAALGNRMSAVTYPDDLAVMTPKIAAQLHTGKTTIENENRLICKDGTIKWVSIKAQLLKDEQGENYFYCVCVDVTKQKQDEQRWRATEKNLEVAVSHVGMYYWEILDFATGLIHVNRQVQDKFGLREYNVGYPQCFLEKDFVAPEDKKAYHDGVQQIYDGKAYSQFDARIKTLRQGYQWMRIRISRIEGENGGGLRAVATAEEIAEYKDLEQRVGLVMAQNEITSWIYDAKRGVVQSGRQNIAAPGFPVIEGDINPTEAAQMKYIHPDDREKWAEFHNRVTQGKGKNQATIRILDKEKEDYRWLRCRYTLMPDREGVPTYALGSAVDVTEQVQAQKRYETALSSRYKSVGDNVVMVGHCSITNNKILDLEDAQGNLLTERYGKERDAFFLSLSKTVPDQAQRKALLEASLNEALKKSFQLGITQHDVTFMSYWDENAIVPRWFSLHIDTVENPQTHEMMGLLTLMDVTQSKKQEQMLETVARRNYDYIAYVNLNEDSMMLYRYAEGGSESAQYEYGKSYCLSAAIGDSAESFVSPEDRALYKEQSSLKNLREKLRSQDSYEFSFHMLQDGVYRTKRMRIDALDRAAGTAVMTRSDVTDVIRQQEEQKKRLSEALEIAESANRHKTDFLASMSHDIRTPMNAIVGMCELALAGEEDTAQVHDSLKTIQLSAQMLLSLINNILDMSRIESGKMEFNDEPFSLTEQIKKTAASYRVLAQQKNQSFRLYLNIRHSSCVGDVSRIHSAVDNILANAIKYTPAGGRVIYRVSEIPFDKPNIGLYRFEISDTGIGISEEEQKHIFEPFFRSKSQKTSAIEGTGLGLSITKEIVELKGGTIAVKSAAGIGTTFVLELPIHLASPNQALSAEKDEKGMLRHDFTGMHILLCEDHPVNQKVVRLILEKVHAEVTIAQNGLEGVQAFELSRPGTFQLVLMDIRMPVMDGYEAAAAIRSSGHPQAKSIPIVALSANAFTEDIQKSLQSGMNAHLSKPVIPEQLCEAIQGYCNSTIEIAPKKKVLFVDDAEINIAVLTACLQGTYEVYVARDGVEALDTLEQNPDMAAVITDLMMPHMDGVTLIKTIRASDRYRNLAVLANTQYGDIAQEDELRNIGADDFLYKPTTPEVVSARVKAALQKRGSM